MSSAGTGKAASDQVRCVCGAEMRRVAYRVADADEIVYVNDGGSLCGRCGDRLRWCSDDGLWSLSGLVLGLARHGLSLRLMVGD